MTTPKKTAEPDAKTELLSARRAYRKERESALEQLDAKLDEFKKNLLEATSGTRGDLDAAMQAVGEKRRRFVARLADLGEASGGAWKDLRKGIDNSWDELEDAFGDLRKGVGAAVGRFKKGSTSSSAR